jgi:hypothetical protein
VIAGKNEDLDTIEPGMFPALPSPEPFDKLFQPAEASRRLCECRLPGTDRRGGMLVSIGEQCNRRPKLGKRGRSRHARASLAEFMTVAAALRSGAMA